MRTGDKGGDNPMIRPQPLKGLASARPIRDASVRTVLVQRTSECPSSGPAPPWTSPMLPRMLPMSLAASHGHPMCNTRSTFEISRCNSCSIQKKTDKTLKTSVWKHLKTITNICNTQMKHLQYTYETPETLERYTCMQRACICNIQILFCNI
jgi:hypothetical protein